ncbi:hypothetical protein F4859DRAFT_498639 [Xylaria cf. heliscus]|nr:hypothetical protein F4859DRAFT_498639 [Xylaria cf. heliscus]
MTGSPDLSPSARVGASCRFVYRALLLSVAFVPRPALAETEMLFFFFCFCCGRHAVIASCSFGIRSEGGPTLTGPWKDLSAWPLLYLIAPEYPPAVTIGRAAICCCLAQPQASLVNHRPLMPQFDSHERDWPIVPV